MARKSTDPRIRFWDKVDKSGECWEWTAAINAYGYGVFTISHGGPQFRAHRLSWEMENGPIPEGLFVCHKCDNRKCVNPKHLFIGTAFDNTADRIKKGKSFRGENHPGCKLTWDKVCEMRSLYVPRKYTAKMIAHNFGISEVHTRHILDGRRRAHI